MSVIADGRVVTQIIADGRDVTQVILDGSVIWTPSSTAPFSPADIAGGLAWYGFDSGAGFTLNGADHLLSLDDAFGVRTALFPSSTEGGVVAADPDIGGLNALTITGANDTMVNTPIGAITGLAAISYYCVSKIPISSGNAVACSLGALEGSFQQTTAGMRALVNDGYTASSAANLNFGGWNILGCRSENGGGGVLYHNGEEVLTFAPSKDVNASVVRVGAYHNGSVSMPGKWASLLIFDRKLTLAEHQKIEGYLAHAFSLTASLPVAHPYKSSAP